MNKKSEPKSKFTIRRILITAVVAFLLIKYVLISLYDNTRLGWHGQPTSAIISPKEYKGARRYGPGKYYYHFDINGVTFEGSAEKQDGISIGDTIKIFYLESEPTVNCSYEYAKGIFFQTIVP